MLSANDNPLSITFEQMLEYASAIDEVCHKNDNIIYVSQTAYNAFVRSEKDKQMFDIRYWFNFLSRK